MENNKDENKAKLGKPLVIRLYQEQRELLEHLMKEENKALVNDGLQPKSSSEYARLVFQSGLESLGLKKR
ncbi:hypothetical protein [Roseivirga sp.]|uniref:hypothetical protein n=1 Tax=Roseivirga sp. TaxID=1964215 RepID=UPI003B52008A